MEQHSTYSELAVHLVFMDQTQQEQGLSHPVIGVPTHKLAQADHLSKSRNQRKSTFPSPQNHPERQSASANFLGQVGEDPSMEPLRSRQMSLPLSKQLLIVDTFQDLDLNAPGNAGHHVWTPPSFEFDPNSGLLNDFPSFEEFNCDSMSVLDSEGGLAIDTNVFSPSGAPTTHRQPFPVDKESMAVMDRFLELFRGDDDDMYEALHT